MSFDSFKKKDAIGKSPLLEDDLSTQFNELQSEYLNFIRDFDEILEYEIRLGIVSVQEYLGNKNEMY